MRYVLQDCLDPVQDEIDQQRLGCSQEGYKQGEKAWYVVPMCYLYEGGVQAQAWKQRRQRLSVCWGAGGEYTAALQGRTGEVGKQKWDGGCYEGSLPRH